MSKLTDFGKALRKLRIEQGEKMQDMANAIGVSVSFLSAIETGAKSVPMEKVEKIITRYDLKGAEARELHSLAAKSKAMVRIKVRPESRQLVTAFARKVKDLSPSKRHAILQILEEE
jgi:transcriptional regulator with XRE-family HTH domain